MPQVTHLEGGLHLFFERHHLCILGAGDHQVVDVDTHQQDISSIAPPIDGRLVRALLEAHPPERRIQLGILCHWCLPQAIEGLAQAHHLALLIGDSEFWWLVHVDLLLQVDVKEHRLDVHVVDTPTLLDSQRKEESHGLHPCHGSVGIVEIDSLPLQETLYHQARLMLDDGADFIPLQLEHPLKGDCTVTTREISKLPGAVFLNRIHLHLHRGMSCRVFLSLCERPRLVVVARKVQLPLQVMGH
jgi:hypothetical protein